MSSACKFVAMLPMKEKGEINKKVEPPSQNVNDFLQRLKNQEQREWENHVFGLIRNGGPDIIYFISDNCFLSPSSKTASFDGATRIIELSSRIPVDLKKRLKVLLRVYCPELIRPLIDNGFSFDSKSFRGG